MNITKTLALAAAAVMASNPEEQVVHVCPDGNIFLNNVKHLAQHHCRQSKLPAPIAVTREELADLIEAKPAKAKAAQAAADEDEVKATTPVDLEPDPDQMAADAAKAMEAINEPGNGGFAPGVTDTERTTPEVFLNGSANQKDLITIRKNWKLTLAQVVRHAHALSKLSADEWNALSDADRDVWIDDAVIALKETPRN